MTGQNKRVVFTNMLGAFDGDVRYMLDNWVFAKEVSEKLEIAGWVVHRKHKIAEVFITSENEVFSSAKLNITRPKVREHFSNFYNSESAGFNLTTNVLPKGKFHLHIRFENGRTKPIAEFELEKGNQRKLLFMHIPKAAGSTVNAFFASYYRENQYALHIESNKKWQTSPDELKKLSFLSGHFNLAVSGKKLNLENYYKVTVVREPYAQLCSHLTWIKRLAMPGEEHRLKQHIVHIQTFAKKLAATDFANVAELKILLDSLEEFEIRLIDNCQVRYFTWIPQAQAVNNTDAQDAIRASAVFDKIGITESIGNFMKEVAQEMKWPVLAVKPARENITQDFYGLNLSDDETREVLQPLIQYDMILYKHVTALLATG